MRQSIPSSNIDSWAGVTLTLPSAPMDVFRDGQTNRPFSRRLANRQAPLAIPPDDLQQIPATPPKDEQVAGMRIG